MEKRKRQHKRELEKSASQMRLIVEIFSSQINKKKSYNTEPAINSLLLLFVLKNLQKNSIDKK